MTTKQIFARLILAALLISIAVTYSIMLGFEGIVFLIFIGIAFFGIVYLTYWALKNF